MLRQIVINNERVHSVVHEPLAHRGAGKRREVLICRRVRRRRGNNCRIRHRAFAFENIESPRDVGILLSDCDVNAIKRPIILVALFFGGLVQARLTDDCVDGDSRFSGRAITDNEFALSAADWNHRVERHDPGLDRLADAAALDHAGRNLFERIRRFTLDRSFVVERLSEGIDDAAEKAFANRNLEKFSRSLHFVAFGNFRGFAEQNRTDLCLFEVQCETENTVRELDHLVEHHVAQAFDASDAIAGFADDADVALGCRCF